jgi:hypothetical protein
MRLDERETLPAGIDDDVASAKETQSPPIYWVKQIHFLQRDVITICQNENGPCPLLAICNVLLLRGHLDIHPYIHCAAPPQNQAYVYANDIISALRQRLITTNMHFSEVRLHRRHRYSQHFSYSDDDDVDDDDTRIHTYRKKR